MNPYSIECMNLAVRDVESARTFYAGVFGIEFTAQALEDATLYEGVFAGHDFVLLPAALAAVTAEQNRMQFDIRVPDLDAAIALVELSGGRTNGRIGEDDDMRCIGVYDPDDNFMVFRQLKTTAE